MKKLILFTIFFASPFAFAQTQVRTYFGDLTIPNQASPTPQPWFNFGATTPPVPANDHNLLCDLHEEFSVLSPASPAERERIIQSHEASLGGCVNVTASEVATIRAMGERAIVDFFINRCQEEVRQGIRTNRQGGCR